MAQGDTKKWSLKDCIDYAYENNLNLLRNQNNLRASENTLRQSKYNRLPSVSGSASWSNGYGRNIDYTNNSYTTQNSSNISYGVGASVNLFSGFQKKHQIEKNKLDLQADLLDIETAKENLALNITSYYLGILYAQEQLQIAKDNLAISQKQQKRIKELVDAGKLPKGNLL
ncbi:MAG: transporter, partial [Bacteroidia bacterium]